MSRTFFRVLHLKNFLVDTKPTVLTISLVCAPTCKREDENCINRFSEGWFLTKSVCRIFCPENCLKRNYTVIIVVKRAFCGQIFKANIATVED